MAVAKRQTKKGKNPAEREQRKNPWTGVGTSGEISMPPSWLMIGASPNLHRAGWGWWWGGDRKYKKREHKVPRWLRQQRICLQCGRPGFDPWVGKTPWREEWLPTPVFLPGELCGQRSLVGYSPWGCKELDRTEQLTFHFKKGWGLSFRVRPPSCLRGVLSFLYQIKLWAATKL